jgi:hypothetical protein
VFKVVRKLSLLSNVSSLIIALVPYPWWEYSIGKAIVVKDSPFILDVSILGKTFDIFDFINLLLFGLRIYVIVISAFYIYYTLIGQERKYSGMFWATILYLIFPVISYVIFNYIVFNYFLPVIAPSYSYSNNYPLIIIGSEPYLIQLGNTLVETYISSYPTIYYWICLALSLVYLVSVLSSIINKKK